MVGAASIPAGIICGRSGSSAVCYSVPCAGAQSLQVGTEVSEEDDLCICNPSGRSGVIRVNIRTCIYGLR